MKALKPIGRVGQGIYAPPACISRQAYLTRPTNHNRHPLSLLQPKPQQPQQRRPFLTNPFTTDPQTISATRTFPYPASQIFAIIADVAAYSEYFPFCQQSVVTKYSEPVPPPDGKRYPEEAKLVVGFHELHAREEFWSRIYCAPERVVEAVSGRRTETTLPAAQIAHHHPRPVAGEEDATRAEGLLEHLLTRWTLRPLEEETGGARTEVSLRIEVQFANPVYAALSQAAVPKVADKMIEAFEKRVEVVVKGQRG